MPERVRLHITNNIGFKMITRVEIADVDIPVQRASLEQDANEPMYLMLRINAAHVDMIETRTEELEAEDESAEEQPESDEF